MKKYEYLEWIKTLDLEDLVIVLRWGILEIDHRKEEKKK